MLFGSRSENGGGMMNSSFGRRHSCSLFPWTVGIRVSKGRKTQNFGGSGGGVDEPGVEEYTKCSGDLKPCKEAPIGYLVR